MDRKNEPCCCKEHDENCLICGKPLVYLAHTEDRECSVCHRVKPANAHCEDGHFVCDECHSSGSAVVLPYLQASKEKNPTELFLQVCKLNGVHMHGPEHHAIVPCVLLTAFYNCGGDITLDEALREAWKRGKKVPGGACGFLGVCGAAAGAGIFASILCDSSPLAADVWDVPQKLTMKCLEKLVSIGGPRCCKRTGRLCIEEAAAFAQKRFGVTMPLSGPACEFSARNRECLHDGCPYFRGIENNG